MFRSRRTFRPMRFLIILTIALSGCALPGWPVDGVLTSPFGVRMDGLMPEIHRGVDISVPIGTPVMAMKGGRVVFAGTMSGYGTTVIIENGATRTLYAHLSELRVRSGDQVRSHQVIALSGASGNAAGPHLHFEILRYGRPEDPVPLLGGFPRPR